MLCQPKWARKASQYGPDRRRMGPAMLCDCRVGAGSKDAVSIPRARHTMERGGKRRSGTGTGTGTGPERAGRDLSGNGGAGPALALALALAPGPALDRSGAGQDRSGSLASGIEQAIRIQGIAEREARVTVKPVLEPHLETEFLAQMPLEECPEVLRTDQVGSDDFVRRKRDLTILMGLLAGTGFRGKQFQERRPHDVLQIIAVIHVADIEIVPGAFVGLPEHDFLQNGLAGLRHLDIKVVVAKEAEQDPVAVEAIVAHHLPDGYRTGTGALVDDKLYEISVASHTVSPLTLAKITPCRHLRKYRSHV